MLCSQKTFSEIKQLNIIPILLAQLINYVPFTSKMGAMPGRGATVVFPESATIENIWIDEPSRILLDVGTKENIVHFKLILSKEYDIPKSDSTFITIVVLHDNKNHVHIFELFYDISTPLIKVTYPNRNSPPNSPLPGEKPGTPRASV